MTTTIESVQIGQHTLFAETNDIGLMFLQNGLNYERHIVVPKFEGAFVDVGANIGFYCFKIRHEHGDGVPYIGIEPNVRNFALLHKNVNALPRTALYLAAAHDHMATLFYHGSNWYTNGLTLPEPNDQFVLGVPLDLIISGRKVGCMKIDVEGHELFAVAGAVQTIRAQKPFIVFEYCPKNILRNGSEPRELLNYIFSFGYQIQVYEKQPGWGGTFTEAAALDDYLKSTGSDIWDLLALPV